jgi:uncharacterized protein with PIN domain
MITAVDTSVLIAIAKQEADAAAWVDLLAEAHVTGQVVICDVVAAEPIASRPSTAAFYGATFRPSEWSSRHSRESKV